MTTTDLIPGSTSSPGPAAAGVPEALRAVHTTNFPGLLRQLGASLLVTTYQAGKLVMIRDEGDHLNTHFRAFQAPMGLALDGSRLAVGTTIQVWEYADVPAVAAIDPEGRTCGVCAVDLASGQVVALLRFDTTVQEIFAVAVLPGRRWPELINDEATLLENSFVVPDAALADVPATLRAPTAPTPHAARVDGKQAEPCERMCG